MTATTSGLESIRRPRNLAEHRRFIGWTHGFDQELGDLIVRAAEPRRAHHWE
jgi:hypothetical protein